MFPGTKNRNEGTCRCSPVPRTGTRVHSPKPRFYETALFPDLLFLEDGKETTQKARISYACRTLKSSGKKGKTLKITRNSLKRKKRRKSKKARKRRFFLFPLDFLEKACCRTTPLKFRSAPQGRQQMGETGFCENLRFSAVSCNNLRFPAVSCGFLRLPNPLIYRAGRKSAKICKNLRKCAFRVRFLPFAVSLLARPDPWCAP